MTGTLHLSRKADRNRHKSWANLINDVDRQTGGFHERAGNQQIWPTMFDRCDSVVQGDRGRVTNGAQRGVMPVSMRSSIRSAGRGSARRDDPGERGDESKVSAEEDKNWVC